MLSFKIKIKIFGSIVLIHVATLLWCQKKIEYIPPLDIPISLSGTFGEPRSTHFHSGIDIKTQGKEGWDVKSIFPGNVSRIRISLGGYGKTLYIDHHNQTSTVYAHLKKFAPKIEAYIKSLQYEKESYTLQQFPKKEELSIKAGEIIGYSGNTGSSSGPHLHFEIRETKTQKPLNPLLFNIPIEDTQRPQIQKLFLFYPKKDMILTHYEQVSINKLNDSTYQTPVVNSLGKMGFGLQMFDRQDLSYSKNGIYRAKVFVNGKSIVHFQFDQLDFSDSEKLFINIDYPHFKKKRIKSKIIFSESKTTDFYEVNERRGTSQC